MKMKLRRVKKVKTNFTPSQMDAIHYEGKNVLVSAGAGSGKTAVLSERVLRKLESGVRIDELIILTFTKAAAEEMKKRIKDKMKSSKALQNQLKYLENAMISTFDSFCLRQVKTYGYLLGIEEEIKISDHVDLELAKKAALDETLKYFYTHPTQEFKEVSSLLFDKGDRVLVSGLQKLISALEKQVLPEKYLLEQSNFVYTEEKMNLILSDFFVIVQDHYVALKDEVEVFYQAFHYDPEIIGAYQVAFNEFFDAFETGNQEQIIKTITTFKFPRKKTIRNDEDLKEKLTHYHDQIKKYFTQLLTMFTKYHVTSINEVKENIRFTETMLKVINNLGLYYYRMLNRIYKENNLYDYTSVMNLTIELFESNLELREDFKQKYNEVMVDEYQDTNDFQEYLITLLTNHNCFMVGDMKQSIYGFRNANPKNFLAKFNNYFNSDAGKLITLDRNFRSRSEVLSDINMIFSKVMDERIGGIDYHKNQALIFGQTAYQMNPVANAHMDVLKYDYQAKLESGITYSRDEYETMIILDDIKQKVDTGYLVYDTQKEELRRCRYQDFCILVDRKTTFHLYEKEALNYQVPLLAVKEEEFSSNIEIMALHQILRLLASFSSNEAYEEYFKSSFYGSFRSFVFQKDDGLLLSLLTSFTGNRKEDFTLVEKSILNPEFQILKQLSMDLNTLPLFEGLLNVLDKLQWNHQLLYLEDPEKSLARMNFFMESISSKQGFTFSDLLYYMDTLYDEEELDISYEKDYNFSENKVKLMTIHKSKGLEFQIVYYPGLHKKFIIDEDKEFFSFHPVYGLYSKTYQNGFFPTILKMIHVNNAKEEMVSERIRLFYVALTRAKEKMIFLLDESKLKEQVVHYDLYGVASVLSRKKLGSFASLISIVPATTGFAKHIEVTKKTEQRLEAKKKEKTRLDTLRFDFNSTLEKKERYSKETQDLILEDDKVKMKIGIKIHALLEHLNFSNPEEQLSRSSEQEKRIIMNFMDAFKEELIGSIAYHEYEFFLEERHGFIDLLLEKEQLMIIIDFKLKKITDLSYITQVKGYMNYIHQVTKKPVKGYLYSLIEGTKLEVIE